MRSKLVCYTALLLLAAAPTAGAAPEAAVPAEHSAAPADCATSGVIQKISITLRPPQGSGISTVAVDLGYDAARVAIPGQRDAESVKQRIQGFPQGAVSAVNDSNGKVRVVLAATNPLPVNDRTLFVVSFDVCNDAAAPTAADYTCVASGCVAMSAPVDGCTCDLAIETAQPG